KTLTEQIAEAVAGGITCLQLREKEMSDYEFLMEALEVKELLQDKNIPLIINDNVDVALKCGADGIHVGQRDMAANDVRKKVGDGMILGVSVQTVKQAVEAEKNGADYLGVGAVFSTSTKLDADSVSYDELKKICASVNIPVVAIGGIGEHNIKKLSGSGLDGVAVVSAIFASSDIVSACQRLRKLSEEMISNET
ncbi:MAG: thiamine phosphate synthase, partial [Clostridia bacterium]|nr:thiamine phosphate synthase [Clostridia bacterium]